jgi:hypothetical protein
VQKNFRLRNRGNWWGVRVAEPQSQAPQTSFQWECKDDVKELVRAFAMDSYLAEANESSG